MALREAIERIVLEHPGYGYRRVTHAPRREGWKVNHKRVLRVMREESLLCQIKRRFVPTTDSRHGLGSHPNLLRGQDLQRPDKWVADLTYIRLPTTYCFLAAILDAWSRRIVGWALSPHIDTDLTLAALERAITASDRCGADPPLRPRGAVRQSPLRRAPGGHRRADQHGGGGQRL
ncbi:MAG: IS3 family transposase [Thermomicrobiales bacterium]